MGSGEDHYPAAAQVHERMGTSCGVYLRNSSTCGCHLHQLGVLDIEFEDYNMWLKTPREFGDHAEVLVQVVRKRDGKMACLLDTRARDIVGCECVWGDGIRINEHCVAAIVNGRTCHLGNTRHIGMLVSIYCRAMMMSDRK
eukprot:jgi/Chlat1/8744/Chrsp9S08562